MKISTHVKFNICIVLVAIILALISIMDVYTAYVYHRPLLHPVINVIWATLAILLGAWLHRKMSKK